MAIRILIVAGDPSGDHHAARLAAELRRREPSVELFGLGGAELRAAGVRVEDDLVALSAIGLWDVLLRLPKTYTMGRRLLRRLATDLPDAAVLVDCGGFNLPLGRWLKQRGVPVLGYFPPGSWSGSLRRARDVAEAYSAVATPFAQPVAAYEQLGLEHEWVGHPLADELADLAVTREALPLDPPRLALLPGSRLAEVRYMLPPMLGAARLLRQSDSRLEVVVSRAPAVPEEFCRRVLAKSGVTVELVEGSRAAMARATAAIVKSGTIAFEAALVGLPMVVVYRGSLMSWLVVGLYYWPRPKYWAMPNLLADDYLVPQMLQYRVTPRRLAREVSPLLTDTPARKAQQEGLKRVTAGLRRSGAVGRTADLLFRLLSRDSRGPA